MCELCDKIYTEEEEKENKMMTECEIGTYIVVEKQDPHYGSGEWYWLRIWDYYNIEDNFYTVMQIKYCPECGKKLFEDRQYHGGLLNKNYRIVKYY